MITNKLLDRIIPVLLAAAMIASVLMIPFVGQNVSDVSMKQIRSSGVKSDYESELFTLGRINEISIEMDTASWKSFLENAAKKNYYSCNVMINGEKLTNVGIRTKGGSSLDEVAAMENSDRYSFMLKFNKFTKGQNYHGLTKLALNNNTGDPSQMKDLLTYDMCRYIGLAAPLCNYAKISLNGEYFGCYLAVEPVDKEFCKRCYGTGSGTLYKPFHDLTYTGDDESDYFGITDDIVVKGDNDSLRKVIAALKSVDSGDNIEDHVDTEAVLKYMAVQTMTVNFDSLTGKNEHNYFLYEKDGKISLIPWDYNLAWGGYSDDNEDEFPEEEFDEEKWREWYASLNEEEKEEMNRKDLENLETEKIKVVNFPVDTPFTAELAQRQFFMKLLENDEYKAKYHEYLTLLSARYIKSGKLDKTASMVRQEIGLITGTENNAFYSYDQFCTSSDMLCCIARKRADSVLGQIKGNIPSTWEGQASEPDKLINCDDIDLSVMGGD